MKRILIVCVIMIAGLSFPCQSCAKESPGKKKSGKDSSMSFVLLSDLHHCDTKYYNLDAMLEEKPGDHTQITKTYAPVTKENWDDLFASIQDRMESCTPAVKGIVQMGDLSEGLANVEGYADAMAKNVIDEIKNLDFDVPWVFVKGNHDITGVGKHKAEAVASYTKYYTKFVQEQGCEHVEDGNCVFRKGDALFVVLDVYNKNTDQVEFVRKHLEESDAKYKFVCMHEPAIPTTERCWHFMRTKPEAEREAFLEILGKNKAIVLCGHLHRYSVLRRNTKSGPVIQIMINSATSLKRQNKPRYEFKTSDYGAPLADWKPTYKPETLEERRATLVKEAEYVDFYKMNNLAGYGILSIDGKKEKVTLKYYAAFEEEPYDVVDITELYNK